MARIALALIVIGAVLSLAAATDNVAPLVLLATILAVGAVAWGLRWLCRVADIPGSWANGGLVILVALTLAVAVTARAARSGTNFTNYYPYNEVATTTAPFTLPNFTNVPLASAIDELQQLGFGYTVVGPEDPSSVVVSQDPPPGSYLRPGMEVRLIIGSPGVTPETFPASPTTTIQPTATRPTTFVTIPPSPTTTS